MGRDRKNEKRGGRFDRYDHAMKHSEAWRALSGNAVKLHLALIERQFKSVDGLAQMSEREACEICGFGSRHTAAKAFSALQEAGFIVLEAAAHLGTNGHGRAAKWRLTHLPYQGSAPTRDWQKFKTPAQKVRHAPAQKVRHVATSPPQTHGAESAPCGGQPPAQKVRHFLDSAIGPSLPDTASPPPRTFTSTGSKGNVLHFRTFKSPPQKNHPQPAKIGAQVPVGNS